MHPIALRPPLAPYTPAKPSPLGTSPQKPLGLPEPTRRRRRKDENTLRKDVLVDSHCKGALSTIRQQSARYRHWLSDPNDRHSLHQFGDLLLDYARSLPIAKDALAHASPSLPADACLLQWARQTHEQRGQWQPFLGRVQRQRVDQLFSYVLDEQLMLRLLRDEPDLFVLMREQGGAVQLLLTPLSGEARFVWLHKSLLETAETGLAATVQAYGNERTERLYSSLQDTLG